MAGATNAPAVDLPDLLRENGNYARLVPCLAYH